MCLFSLFLELGVLAVLALEETRKQASILWPMIIGAWIWRERFVPVFPSAGWALLRFHSSLEDDPGDALSSWNANDADPCGWFGVGCENGRVTSV
jgi:hypothetical protein